MTLALWNLSMVLSLIILIVCIYLLVHYAFIKNRYYQDYTNDEIIKTTETSSSLNKLYFTSGETTRFIKKYVLCKTDLDKYIICNYNKPYGMISFFILCYKNNKDKPFKVFKYSELKTGVASRVISIPKKTENVNVIVSEVDSKTINYRIIKPMSLKTIKLFSIILGLATFSLLYFLRHIIAFFMTSSAFFLSYLNSFENYIIIITSLVVSILIIVVTIISYRQKAKVALNGGAVEYDFL